MWGKERGSTHAGDCTAMEDAETILVRRKLARQILAGIQ